MKKTRQDRTLSTQGLDSNLTIWYSCINFGIFSLWHGHFREQKRFFNVEYFSEMPRWGNSLIMKNTKIAVYNEVAITSYILLPSRNISICIMIVLLQVWPARPARCMQSPVRYLWIVCPLNGMPFYYIVFLLGLHQTCDSIIFLLRKPQLRYFILYTHENKRGTNRIARA